MKINEVELKELEEYWSKKKDFAEASIKDFHHDWVGRTDMSHILLRYERENREATNVLRLIQEVRKLRDSEARWKEAYDQEKYCPKTWGVNLDESAF